MDLNEEHKLAVDAIIGSQRMRRGLPIIPDPISGDLKRVESLQDLLVTVYNLLKRPASNYRLMQIAEPARRIRNLIKQHLPLSPNENINPPK